MQDRSSIINPEEITPHAALVLVDNALLQAVGQRLNDLESSIFLGSWEGKTYDEIYPSNPEYIEKSVGYKLWKKLSIALGEKVSKKRIRGAVMRRYRDLGQDLGGAPGAAEALAKEAKYAVIWQREAALKDEAVIQTLSDGLKDLGYRVRCGVSSRPLGFESQPPKPLVGLAETQYDDVLVITFSDQDAAPDETASSIGVGD
ncbi:hypothetical protein VB780_21725 [Leptolyngbya sp. CCNP1308]|uniref:hypothetical protein n=1 Tax=Leptolyngbya sp. CCNP1308 TaxID=3110255 RepID=UPI002B1EC843|nr:hypothetical protein [Leptolyngbya sp. CCNP1308]MEA5451215.1 hypothetical protein [Leptolyngbya sp. CCNP1308]